MPRKHSYQTRLRAFTIVRQGYYYLNLDRHPELVLAFAWTKGAD